MQHQVGPIVFVVPPGAERSFEALAPRAEAILDGVSQSLGITPRAPFRMVLIPANGLSDSNLVRFDRGAPPWAAGFMDPRQRAGAIRLGHAARYPYGTPESVLAHESAHLLMHDAPGVELPLWFEEGVATWAARSWQFEDVFQLSSRIITRDLPRLDDLEPRFHGDPGEVDQAYAASFAFVSWSVSRYGSASIRDVLTRARTHSFERAWMQATGSRIERAESEWRRDSLFRYRWVPLIAGSGSLWLVVMAVAAWVWLRKRRRARALEQAWADEDDWTGGEWTGDPDAREAPEAAGSTPQAPPAVVLEWKAVEEPERRGDGDQAQ